MIPVKLSLEGIYSYKEKQTIDFATLTDNHLFGIFGGVGSGKSTILEAITFALFGETERLNNRENRNYNMMNLKSNQLFIEFIFTAGKDNKKYRFNVTGKRNSKRFEDVKTLTRSAYVFENENWIPLDSADASAILGLSYENFKRTIIIPQGKFQEFLQLGDAPRTKMLQEIFRLDRFDLTDKVKSLSIGIERDLEHTKGRLAELEEVSEEIIKIKDTELKKSIEELKLKEEELNTVSLQIKSFEALEKLNSRKKDLFIQIESNKSKENQINKLESDLNEYLACKEQFEYDLSNREKLLNQKNSLESDLSDITPKLDKTKDTLATAKSNFAVAEAEYTKKSEYLKQIEDLKKIATIKELEIRLENHTAEISENEIKQEHIEKELQAIKKESNEQAERQIQLSSKRDELTTLKEIANWHKSKLILIRELNNYSEKIDNLGKKKNVQLKKLDDILLNNEYLESLPKNDIKALTVRIEAVLIDLEKEKDLEKSKMLEANARTQIAAEAKNLKEGDPCPVCGSTSHPAIKEFEIGTNLVAESTKILDRLDAKIRILFQMKKTLSEIEYILKNVNSEKLEYTAEMGRVNEEIKALIENYKWDITYKDKKALLDDKIAEYELLSEEFDQVREHLDKLKITLNEKEEQLSSIKKHLNNRYLLKERISSEKNTLQETLEQDTFRKFSNSELDVINTQKDLLILNIKKTDELFAKLNNEIKMLEQEQTSLTTTFTLKEEQIAKIDSEISILENSIEKKIQAGQYTSIDEILKILNQRLNKTEILSQIEEFRSKQSQLMHELSALEKEIDGRFYDSDLHQKEKHRETELKQTVKRITESIGSLQSDISKMKDKLELKTQLLKEFEAKEIRKQNIQIMAKLFKAKGFVNYISTVYLQQLCTLANKRFTLLTNRQLELVLNDNNNFEVRDYMNGGKLRSVKTLSGGQTFQASLSLALSLAESVQSQIETKHNFFFLDEGFGSLDKNSLGIVFDTLKSLRKENRIVGLISHVEELQEEIDVFLKLRNDPENGTQISKSWKN